MARSDRAAAPRGESATERMWREYAEQLKAVVAKQDRLTGVVVEYVDDLIDRVRQVNATNDGAGAFALYTEQRLCELVQKIATEIAGGDPDAA